jgi:2-polyprenyl-3-methyl-5-hydroxy-6-metoxy-1,4-benzoquinol methylase
MESEKISFSFGKNWSEFIKKHFSEERVAVSQKHILKFLGLKDLQGKYFLDIGCGSGLQSLSAHLSGAEKVVSFDVDEFSVQTCNEIKKGYNDPENWSVLKGSILDKNFISKLERADIVYSWGVLHHTGDMWSAIKNASTLIKDNGLFYIALYTTDHKSEYWLGVKKKYNRAGNIKKGIMEAKYVIRHLFIPYLLTLQNPFKIIRDHKKNRGMSYFTDVKDWLGGYPYEFARPEEVIFFCKDKLGLDLINLKTGEANTEYLFKKTVVKY